MPSTTSFNESTLTQHAGPGGCSDELKKAYYDLVTQNSAQWEERLVFKRILGQGGQGIVFLSERNGTDGFVLPVAVKVFIPERYANDLIYHEEMCYLARMSAKVAGIQNDRLLNVHNWRSIHRVRIMEMEWVDGLDLEQLLRQEMLYHLHQRVSPERWKHVNEVVVTTGDRFPRLLPGIAIPIIRDCLAALGALHREGIVHGDMKPSNIMLKRNGNAKVVDLGSAFEIEDRPSKRPYTLAYAAPEVLEGKEITPRSDMASLGYILVEMLSGKRLFGHNSELKGLSGRLNLASQLKRYLPPDTSEKLLSFCKGLVAPDPNKRFENAEAADLLQDGAVEFQRQLVLGNLAVESEPEIRSWFDDLEEYIEKIQSEFPNFSTSITDQNTKN